MKDDDAELLKAFLKESESHMAEFHRWLDRPHGTEEALADAFRWMHTLAGSSGFFGFARLRKTARAAANCLGVLRDRRTPPDPALRALFRTAVADIRRSLAVIASSGRDLGGPSPAQSLLEDWARGGTR